MQRCPHVADWGLRSLLENRETSIMRLKGRRISRATSVIDIAARIDAGSGTWPARSLTVASAVSWSVVP